MSLLRADFTTHEYGPHTHDAFVIAVTEAGGAEIQSRGIAEKVGPCTLFVSNPEERQSARMADSDRWIYRAFYLTRPAIDAVAHKLGVEAAPYFMRNMVGDIEAIERFGRLHRAFEAESDDFRADELVVDAFGVLFQRYGSGVGRPERAGQDRTAFNRIVELMRARYAENLRLDDLADFAGLTSFQLIGLFKRTIGLTPHAYLIHIRLNAACRRLRPRMSSRRERAGRRILRPKRAHQALQALLRNHAIAVHRGRASELIEPPDAAALRPAILANTAADAGSTATPRRFASSCL